MEPGRDSRSPLRSQGLDYEVQGGNLCEMQAECNRFALTYGSTRDLTVLTLAKYRDPLGGYPVASMNRMLELGRPEYVRLT
jgi:hypothetical protein